VKAPINAPETVMAFKDCVPLPAHRKPPYAIAKVQRMTRRFMGSYLSTGPPYCHKPCVPALTNNLNLYTRWAALDGIRDRRSRPWHRVPNFWGVSSHRE
jgi:hypothetical protein